jgi:hypothetical protein
MSTVSIILESNHFIGVHLVRLQLTCKGMDLSTFGKDDEGFVPDVSNESKSLIFEVTPQNIWK